MKSLKIFFSMWLLCFVSLTFTMVTTEFFLRQAKKHDQIREQINALKDKDDFESKEKLKKLYEQEDKIMDECDKCTGIPYRHAMQD